MTQKVSWRHKAEHSHKFLKFRYILLIIAIIIVALWIKRFTDSSKYFKKGSELYSQQKIAVAIENLEKASHLNPWSARTFNSLAIAYGRQKLYTKSYAAAKKATELKPNYESALVIFGESCFHLARNEEKRKNYWGARKFYREGVLACKKALAFTCSPDTIHYLGTAYSSLGEYDEGIIFFTGRMPGNRNAQEQVNLLMEAKRNFLAGTGPNQIVDADTEGPLPSGAEIAVIGHPILKFIDTETKNFQNGVFYSDLDSDKQPELILIYKMPGNDNKVPCYVSVFMWNVNKWDLRWHTKISDYDVGYFTVEDINGDTKPEILIEGIYDAKSGALVNIYACDGLFIRAIQQLGPTWGTTLYDVDGDGAKEIIILDRKKDEYNSIIYKWNTTKYVKVDE